MPLIHRSLQNELMIQLSYNIQHNSERDFEQIGAPLSHELKSSTTGLKWLLLISFAENFQEENEEIGKRSI